MKKGRAGTMMHDHKRCGTTTPFAALEGKVIGRCMQRNLHQEFIRFLNAVEAEAPLGKSVHLIADNIPWTSDLGIVGGGPGGRVLSPMRQNRPVEEGRIFWPIGAIEGAKMEQKSGPVKEPAEQVVREIRRAIRRQFQRSRRSALS
jgi:hypothetical protein